MVSGHAPAARQTTASPRVVQDYLDSLLRDVLPDDEPEPEPEPEQEPEPVPVPVPVPVPEPVPETLCVSPGPISLLPACCLT